MAFSKAKILRFNDIKTCAPPPGAYNPKYEEKVAGTIISGQTRFPESPSPSNSYPDLKSVHSNSSTPCFRTPTIPRRKKMTHLINSAGRKCSSVKLFSPKHSEALREKMVECINKNESIKDLDNQLEDLKLEISKLKAEKALAAERDELIKILEDSKSEFENELIKIKEQYSKDIENINAQLAESRAENKSITENFNEMEAKLKAKNTAEMKQQQDNIELLQIFIKQSLTEAEATLKETETKLAKKESACCNLQGELLKKCEELCELELQYNESLTTQAELQRSHANEIKSLKHFHRTEVEDVEYEMLKLVTEWRNVVTELKTNNTKIVSSLKEQECSKLDELKMEYEKREIELKESTEKEVKKIREEEEQKWNTKLQEKLKIWEKERDEVFKKIESEAAQRRAEVSCYEVTLQKTRATMDTLKRRLLESDSDVERLKERLSQLEAVENNHQSVETRVRDVEMRLLARVDELTECADTEITRLNSVVDEKQRTITELSTFIHSQQRLHLDAQALVGDAKIELERLEAEKTEYQFKITRLENTTERAQLEAARLASENEKQRECEVKLQQQNRTIERLRQELAQVGRPVRLRSPAVEKENSGCGSPSKQLAKTPTRFGSPLRERN